MRERERMREIESENLGVSVLIPSYFIDLNPIKF